MDGFVRNEFRRGEISGYDIVGWWIGGTGKNHARKDLFDYFRPAFFYGIKKYD